MAEVSRQLLSDIDDYIDRLFGISIQPPPHILETAASMGLPKINVSATEGRLLWIITKIIGARAVLEIGSLCGYSSWWFASAMPADGRFVTIEVDPERAQATRSNLRDANLQCEIEVVCGDAHEALAELASAGKPAFDLVFIDADEESYDSYLASAIKVCRPGGLILSDNVIRNGAVIAPSPDRLDHQALAQFNLALPGNINLTSLIVPMINRETIDGLAISIVKKPTDA